MKGHIFATYWIGGAVGLLVGTIIGFGISMSGDTCGLHLPAVTMGDEAQLDCLSNDHTTFCKASR